MAETLIDIFSAMPSRYPDPIYEAGLWREYGFTPYACREWFNAGVTSASSADDLRRAGLTPTSLAVLDRSRPDGALHDDEIRSIIAAHKVAVAAEREVALTSRSAAAEVCATFWDPPKTRCHGCPIQRECEAPLPRRTSIAQIDEHRAVVEAAAVAYLRR